MKKTLAMLTLAALLCACGCGKQTAAPAETTESTAPQISTPQWDTEDDLALPDVNESGSTTAPVVAQQTTQPAAAPALQQAPILARIEQAQNAPAPTTTAAPTTAAPVSEPAAPEQTQAENAEPAPAQTTTTTTQPVETTTAAPKKAEMLQSAVLQPIASGTYTETISAFLNDHSADDKLSKIVRGGETAYWITVPSTNLTFKVFPSGGKYYLATPTQYVELTKAQYNSVCANLDKPFFDFSKLQYQSSETVREGLKKYTVEHFGLEGGTLDLWYNGGSLMRMQMGSESLPISVSGSADSGYFSLGANLQQTDYATLEPIINLSGVLF